MWISRGNRVVNDRNQRQTARFGSLQPLLTRLEKFGKVGKTSFCKGGTTWPMWSPLCYWAEFSSVHISWQSSGKRSQPTEIARFGSLQPLLTRLEQFGKVGKTSFNKRGITWPMWSPLCYWAEFSSVHISWQSSGKRSQPTANTKIREPPAFAKQIREVWKSGQKSHFAKGGPHGPCGPPPLLLGRIFKRAYLVAIEW